MPDNYPRNSSGFGKSMASPYPALHYIAPAELADLHNRVIIAVRGRFMCADQSEHQCHVDTMSPSEAVISCGRRPKIGERIVAYLDFVGRIEGQVIEIGSRSFIISINATDRKRHKLAAQLTWLARKHELGLPEDRRHDRVTPSNSVSEIVLDDGQRYPCRIIDLSVSGAAVEIDVRPDFGATVVLGTMRGRVIRHFEEGIAMEFMTTQPEETIHQLARRGATQDVRLGA